MNRYKLPPHPGIQLRNINYGSRTHSRNIKDEVPPHLRHLSEKNLRLLFELFRARA